MKDKEGYLTVITNMEDIQNSFLMAVTLKHFDPSRKIVLFTDEFYKIPKSYQKLFDSIYKLPYNSNNSKNEKSDINCWQLYYGNVFERSLYVNPNLIITSEIESLWTSTENDNIRLISQVNDIRNNFFIPKEMVYENNDIDMLFGNMFYFNDNNNEIEEFFKVLDVVSQHWKIMVSKYIKNNRPEFFDFNLALSITSQILGEKYYHDNTWFSYTKLPEENLDIWVNNDLSLQLNNHLQYGAISHNNDLLRKEYYDRIKEKKAKN